MQRERAKSIYNLDVSRQETNSKEDYIYIILQSTENTYE